MANGSESIPPPNLHRTNPIRKSSQILPGGRGTLAVILSTVVFVFAFANYYPEQIQSYYGSPEPTHTSHQTIIAGMLLALYLMFIYWFCFLQYCQHNYI